METSKMTSFWRAVDRRLGVRMSWADLARKMGMESPAALYAAREHEPKFDLAVAVADALGVTTADIEAEMKKE